jgi:anti-sigma factor RsiW
MTTQLDDDTLQRYYDGELSPVEERAVRARVESDASAQARLAELEKLSALLRTAADEMGAGLDSNALFAGIQADLKKDAQLGAGAKLRVIREEWSEHRRGAVIGLAFAGAVAAAALLAVLTPGPGPSDELARSASRPEKTRLAEVTPPAQPRPSGSSVENVDFGENTGTVFEIESEGVKTAVVWIAEEDEGTEP